MKVLVAFFLVAFFVSLPAVGSADYNLDNTQVSFHKAGKPSMFFLDVVHPCVAFGNTIDCLPNGARTEYRLHIHGVKVATFDFGGILNFFSSLLK